MISLRHALSSLISLIALPVTAEEIELAFDELIAPVQVSLPENHDPAQSWPAVFSYHGTNGRPETRSIRAHTGPKDWIVVGMSYTQAGQFKLTPQTIATELKVFQNVRDQLVEKHGLDPKRVYLAGFSKGGWMTDSLLQAGAPVAGGAILMGGHLPQSVKGNPAIPATTEIFIGVGRLDPNHLPALKALVFYRSRKLNTCFEAWPGLGHQFPTEGSAALREWFTLRNGGEPELVELEAELEAALDQEPAAAWHSLIQLADRPFTLAAEPSWSERISAERSKLEQTPEGAREAKLRRTHRQLLSREIKMRTLDELRKIDAGYMALAEGATDSPQLDVIRHDHRRILAVLKQAEAAAPPTPKPEPRRITPPDGNRRIPANPLVR